MFVCMSVFVSISSLWLVRFAICFMMDIVGVKIGAHRAIENDRFNEAVEKGRKRTKG